MGETETKIDRLKRQATLGSILAGAVLGAGALGLALATHSADLNNDGQVNQADLDILRSQWRGSGSGDLNHDGLVSFADAGILFSRWGTLPPPPPPPPTPTGGRRPQILLTHVGGQEGGLTSTSTLAEVNLLADRWDFLAHELPPFPSNQIAPLRARNPNIKLLKYRLPHASQSQTSHPSTYYVRDLATGSTVTKYGWYLLDIRQAAVRSRAVTDLINNAPAGLDGHWIDVSMPDYHNTPFVSDIWRNSAGAYGDIGDIDGGWTPAQSYTTRPNYTDGTWPGAMLNLHNEIRAAAGPSSIILYNGLLGYTNYNNPTSGTFWQGREAAYLAVVSGVTRESIPMTGTKQDDIIRQTESVQLQFLQRFAAVVASGKYLQMMPGGTANASARLYGFVYYLLFADGQYAIWRDRVFVPYDTALYDTDYGVPDTSVNGGNYQTLTATPSGTIWKRTFTRARVYVNPGTITRTADGKTLAPQSAIIEMIP